MPCRTSQVCPQCDVYNGKKDLSDRLHICGECRYETHRDVAATQVNRISLLNQVIVEEIEFTGKHCYQLQQKR